MVGIEGENDGKNDVQLIIKMGYINDGLMMKK